MIRIQSSLMLTMAALLIAGCAGEGGSSDQSAGEAGLTKVDLALNWYAEAEHAGYVAADQLGYFKEAGLNVNIRQGGPGAPNLVIQELAAGRIEFAISNADLVVLARAKGVPVVAVAAPLQQSPRCIMVHESAGFETLQDIKDVELAISDSRPFALWMKKKLPLTNVTMVPYSGQVGEFLQKKDFAQQGYVFSEPFLAKDNGGDPQVLMLSDIGFNPYSSLLVTTEDVIKQKPTLVSTVVSASVRGWQSYLTDPEPINAAINKANEDMSLAALAFGAESMQPLCQPAEGAPLCNMTLERWTTLVQQIEELEEIDADSVDPAACFNTGFLPPPEMDTP
ncbi:ABC transporter substrate-binding protein [Fuerstiella marisgermanici]|uniref:Thiamine biosynthesis protein n=1 Tax=Fuerstiella marisgermanici TaxID=1891926 RepID=A0A1P8WF43_9PLAN|nr:ABC transporter substrate-binding protein [Fuerstiella marisgermanici]APZ92671.1 Putative thiamine biosynthesis protein [Fuerstiella marisgermanici]